VHRLCLLLFAFERLKVVETTLARHLALELFESIERHPRCICPGSNRDGESRAGMSSLQNVLVGLKDLSCLVEIINILVRVGLCGLEKGLRWLCEDDTLASACWHGEIEREERGTRMGWVGWDVGMKRD